MLEPLPLFRTNLLEPQEGFEPPMIPAYKAGAVGHCATGANENCEMYYSERCWARTNDLPSFPQALITN